MPPIAGLDPRPGRAPMRRADGRRAVRGAGLQDPDRPVRRAADLLAGLLRHASRAGEHGPQRAPRPARAHRPPAADAREQARGDQGGRAPATSSPPSGLKRLRHRRHALRPGAADRARADRVPGAGDRDRDRAAEQGRRGQARRRAPQAASSEDPTFQRPASTRRPGQTLISGMGELHLEIIVDRLQREFGVEANVGRPQVAYRETIRAGRAGRGPLHPPDRRPRPVRARLARASSRCERGAGFVFENAIVGGVVPKEFVPAVEQGRRGGAREGRARRLPAGRREGPPRGRLVPRGRLLGDGVQDRRRRWPCARPRCARARSCSSR